MTHIKNNDLPMWLWLRRIARDVWTRDWPDDWWCWKSIREE